MVTELYEAGDPPWAEVHGQPCLKYATVSMACLHVGPWIAALIDGMCRTINGSPLVDVRWWEHLEPGQIPGVPGWHYDTFNDATRGTQDVHRLYIAGAGCRTEFRGGYLAPEGTVIGYDHEDEHRISPATKPGPRLLVRVSLTTIRPANRVYAGAHIHPTLFGFHAR